MRSHAEAVWQNGQAMAFMVVERLYSLGSLFLFIPDRGPHTKATIPPVCLGKPMVMGRLQDQSDSGSCITRKSHHSTRIREVLVQLMSNHCHQTQRDSSLQQLFTISVTRGLFQNSEFPCTFLVSFMNPPPSSRVPTRQCLNLEETGTTGQLSHFLFLGAKQGRDVNLRHDCSNFQLQHSHAMEL